MPAAPECQPQSQDDSQKWRDNIRYTIVTMTALISNAYLCYTYLPSKWALPLTLILDGFFYVISPLDLIPDDWMYGKFQIGKYDDYLALIVAATGAVILYMTIQINPVSPVVVDWMLEFVNIKKITVYNISLLLFVLSCWFVEKARFFYIGIHAFFSTPLAIFAVLNGNWAIGASLVAIATIYYLLPFSLAMFIGEQQNFNMTFLVLAIGGVVLLTAHIQGTPVFNSEPWVPAVFSEAARTIRPAGVKAEL
jgi:uncharacterized membrane protein YkvA (DUF1232 family)